MKTVRFLFLFFAAFCLKASASPAICQPENISILLERDVSEVLLEAKGAFAVIDSIDKGHLSSGSEKRFVLRPTDTGIKWGEEFPVTRRISIVPKSEATTFFVNGIQYQGSIHVIKKNNTITLVNEIDIESYIKSILSQEFNCSLENEVLSSVAIAARTTAYYNVYKNRDVFWHVSKDDTKYSGAALIISSSPIIKAIDATRHLILVTNVNGKDVPFEALWTENSAGHTASYQSIFRKEVNFPQFSIKAPHAALNREASKWSSSISKTELEKTLGIKNIQAVNPYIDPVSQKTYGLHIKAEKEVKDLDFINIQKILGENILKSSDFKIDLKDNRVIFTGYGKGSGVGLCLYSASLMAQNGDIAVKILSKFFPQTFIVNLAALPEEMR